MSECLIIKKLKMSYRAQISSRKLTLRQRQMLDEFLLSTVGDLPEEIDAAAYIK